MFNIVVKESTVTSAGCCDLSGLLQPDERQYSVPGDAVPRDLNEYEFADGAMRKRETPLSDDDALALRDPDGWKKRQVQAIGAKLLEKQALAELGEDTAVTDTDIEALKSAVVVKGQSKAGKN